MSEQIEFEEFERLDLDAKYDYIVEWMTSLMKEVTVLAKRILARRESLAEKGEQIEDVAKSVDVLVTKNDFVKNILRGSAKSMYDKGLFEKERDVVKEMTRKLSGRWMMYV